MYREFFKGDAGQRYQMIIVNDLSVTNGPTTYIVIDVVTNAYLKTTNNLLEARGFIIEKRG